MPTCRPSLTCLRSFASLTIAPADLLTGSRIPGDQRRYPRRRAERRLRASAGAAAPRRLRDSAARVGEALEMVRLGGFAGRRTYEMSGGQQQRVALARAIVNRPSVLLLDEPLGSRHGFPRSSLIDLPGEVLTVSRTEFRNHDAGGPNNISRSWLVAELDKHALQPVDGA